MIELVYAGNGNSKFAKQILDSGVRFGTKYAYQSNSSTFRTWYQPELISVPAADIDDRLPDWILGHDNPNLDLLISNVYSEAGFFSAGLLAEWFRQKSNGLIAIEPTSPMIVGTALDHIDSENFDTIAYAPADDKTGDILKELTGINMAYWLTRGYPHQQMKAAIKLGLDNIHYVDVTPTQVMAARSLIWYHYKIPGALNRWFASMPEAGIDWPTGVVGKQYKCLELSINHIRAAWDELYTTPPPPTGG